MAAFATTRLSSKGQVVIPEDIRKNLGLHPGDHFVAVGNKDVIILKRILQPSIKDLDDLIETARDQARQAKLKKNDIKIAIKEARYKK